MGHLLDRRHSARLEDLTATDRFNLFPGKSLKQFLSIFRRKYWRISEENIGDFPSKMLAHFQQVLATFLR
jgi:hypothetical protein